MLSEPSVSTLKRPTVMQLVDALAGAQSLVDRALQVLRVDAELDAQRVVAGGAAAGPGAEVPAHLEVDDADHSAPSGGGCRGARPRIPHLVRHRRDRGADLERGILADQPGRMPRMPVHRERGAVEPHAVQVAAHEHDRHVAGCSVEIGEVRRVGPHARRGIRRRRAARRPLRRRTRSRRRRRPRLPRRGRGGQVEALRGERPLGEVDVLVPEAGHQPAARRGRRLACRTIPVSPIAAMTPSSIETSTSRSASRALPRITPDPRQRARPGACGASPRRAAPTSTGRRPRAPR